MLILKGILLYSTVFIVMLFISGIDSICENNYVIQFLIAIFFLISICCKLITNTELKQLTFNLYDTK